MSDHTDTAQASPDATSLERGMLHMKEVMGIPCANCATCRHLGSDDDGGEPECSQSWPVCELYAEHAQNPSFPFATEMPCWEPEFWHSRFAEMVDHTDASLARASAAFIAARDSQLSSPGERGTA